MEARHQQPVVPPGAGAGDRAHGEAAGAVGQEPLQARGTRVERALFPGHLDRHRARGHHCRASMGQFSGPRTRSKDQLPALLEPVVVPVEATPARSFRTTVPPFMTKKSFAITAMFCEGSPGTATTSASF